MFFYVLFTVSQCYLYCSTNNHNVSIAYYIPELDVAPHPLVLQEQLACHQVSVDLLTEKKNNINLWIQVTKQGTEGSTSTYRNVSKFHNGTRTLTHRYIVENQSNKSVRCRLMCCPLYIEKIILMMILMNWLNNDDIIIIKIWSMLSSHLLRASNAMGNSLCLIKWPQLLVIFYLQLVAVWGQQLQHVSHYMVHQ